MKKSWISVSLALFLAVIGAASFTRCGSDGGLGVDLGDSPLTATDLAGIIDGACTACDGEWPEEGVTAKGFGDDDVNAVYAILSEITGYAGEGISVEEILDALDELNAIPTIDNPDGVSLSLTGTAQSLCANDSGTVTITQTYLLTFTALEDNDAVESKGGTYTTLEGGDYIDRGTVSFGNCLVEGGFFTAGEQAVRINGSVTYTYRSLNNADDVEDNEIEDVTLTGSISIAGVDSDTASTTENDPFWVGAAPAVFDALYDDVDGFFDGGTCIGAGVDPGPDPELMDDDCATDADEPVEIFEDASDCGIGLCD